MYCSSLTAGRGAMGTAFLAGLLLLAGPAAADLAIHCLDIGQGDATLIVSPSGQTMLIDGGPDGSGTGVIVPYLSSLGTTELDYMVATHYHSDHIGGLDEVYHYIGVAETVYDRGWSYPSSYYDTYAMIVSSQRQPILEGQVIDLGGGVTVTCLGLNGNGQLSSPFDVYQYENEYSIALLVDHRSVIERASFTGPAGDPLLHAMPDRCYGEAHTQPWMLRIVDVPKALTARGWGPGRSGRLELRVADDVLPENDGRWTLEVGDGRALVAPGGSGALELDVRGLAALYTGFQSAEELAAAGLATGSERDLAVASSLFAGPAPWMNDAF